MNKLRWVFAAILIMVPNVFGASSVEPIAAIGPATSSAQVTITAGSSGIKNCVSDFDVISDSTYTFRVLDGGTTIYAMNLVPNAGLIRSWGRDGAICGSSATSMTLSISSGTYAINYKGFTRK